MLPPISDMKIWKEVPVLLKLIVLEVMILILIVKLAPSWYRQLIVIVFFLLLASALQRQGQETLSVEVTLLKTGLSLTPLEHL